MNTTEHREFRERMRLLLALFAHELPDRMDEIEVLWGKLQIEWDIKVLQELHRSVHNLVSNGKTFGYPELSIEARALEQVLKSLMQKDIPADALQASRILQQILELKKIATEKESILTIEVISKATDEHVLVPEIPASNLIFVVEDDFEAAQELALQLRYYGYEVEVYNHLDKFRAAV